MKAETAVFKALADTTRRQILFQLRDGELSAGEISSRFDISGPSISRHLGILKNADLVAERREGNRIIYRLQPESLAITVTNFVSTVCPVRIITTKQRTRKAATR